MARPHSVIAGLALVAALIFAGPAGAADSIAYECGQDICLINPDDLSQHSNLTETTAGVGNEAWPQWSPDGTRIAYVGHYISTGFEDINIYVLDPAEAAPRTAIDVSQSEERDAAGVPPQWSPDGTRLAWSATADSSANPVQTGLYVGAANGASLPFRIGEKEGAHPTWSADGTKIAFGAGIEAIYLTSALSSGPSTFLTNGLGHQPQWSPNGQWIAAERSPSYPYKVRVVAADGSSFHELAKPIDSSSLIDWSPDSSKVVYVDDEIVSDDQVWVAPADGSGEGVKIPMPPGWIVPHNPTFSPDGTRVAFDARPETGLTYEQILVAPSDGSAVATPITFGAEHSESPDWKPGGTNPNPPVTPGGGGAGGSGGGGAGTGTPKTQPLSVVKLAYFKQPRILGGDLIAVSIDCHAQGGHPTGWVAEVCAANASAYTRAVAPAGLRPYARAKGGAVKIPFAKGSVKVPEGKTKPLKMAITAAGKKLLKRGKPLKLTLTVTSRRGSGTPTKSTKTITVTPPRPKH